MPSSVAPAPNSPAVAETAVGATRQRVALIGNPNTGKTTLFNRLCGLRAKTANFPGTTTDARVGTWILRHGSATDKVDIIDLPGLYRLSLDRPESLVCRQVVRGEGLYRRPDALVVVVDATNLHRHLLLVGELLASGLPTLVVLNMVDLAQRRGLTIDSKRLGENLGCPVVPMVARAAVGLEALEATLGQMLRGETAPSAALRPVPQDLDELSPWADRVIEDSVGGDAAVGSASDTFTQRLDEAFTHPVLGVLLFAAVMGGLFWTLFALATVPMDLIEATFGTLGGWLGRVLPAGAIHDLLVDGLIGGIAGTVVFLPQICLLFFLISLLEDTGYLARAAFVMDRVLCRFGLPGHAFVPLLSSHACALPGIMATKLIPDPRDRLTTILVAPFMSCSARLPVYVLITSLLFGKRPLMAGLLFTGCYMLGAAAAFFSAWLARRTVVKGRSTPMVLELPTYKRPSFTSAALTAYHQGKNFLSKAGTLIIGISVVMWWLSAYPKTAPPPAAEALRAQAAAILATAPAQVPEQALLPRAPAQEARDQQAPDQQALDQQAHDQQAHELLAQANFLAAKHQQSRSFAGRIGQTIQPVFAPLGYDWQLTVGVLTSFLAREIFVSTMAVLTVGPADSDLEDPRIMERIRKAQRDDGGLVFGTATSASLLIFFVLAMQCLPTLALTGSQTGSWKWAALQLAYMSTLAYVCAFLTYHGLRALGVS